MQGERAIFTGRVARIGDHGFAMPAQASKAIGSAFPRPRMSTPEDGTRVHENGVVAAGAIATNDQPLAVGRTDILPRGALSIGVRQFLIPTRYGWSNPGVEGRCWRRIG